MWRFYSSFPGYVTQLIMIHLYEFSCSPYFSILPQVLHEMLIKFWIDDDYFILLSAVMVRAFKSFAHWTFRKKQKQCQALWKNSLSCPVFGHPRLYLHSAPISFKYYSCIFFWEYIYLLQSDLFLLPGWNILDCLILFRPKVWPKVLLLDISPIWSTTQILIYLNS